MKKNLLLKMEVRIGSSVTEEQIQAIDLIHGMNECMKLIHNEIKRILFVTKTAIYRMYAPLLQAQLIGFHACLRGNCTIGMLLQPIFVFGFVLIITISWCDELYPIRRMNWVEKYVHCLSISGSSWKRVLNICRKEF